MFPPSLVLSQLFEQETRGNAQNWRARLTFEKDTGEAEGGI